MYRKKMMVIATVFIVTLLAVIVWSSNIVAEHDKKMNGNKVSQETGSEIMDGDFGKEHLQEYSEEMQNALDSSVEGNLQRPSAGGSDKVVPLKLDETDIEPQVMERSKPKKRIYGNYLGQMKNLNRLILWNENTFPLKVYLKDESSMPAGFADGIKTSFNNWTRASGNFISFNFVQTQEGADIIVELTDTATGDCISEGGVSYGFDIIGNVLRSAYLKIPKNDCSNNPVTASKLYLTLQHNIGHILGLQNHSEQYTDVMYSSLTTDNMNVTSIDTATLKYLYNFIPTVTNKLYTKAELKNKRRFSEIKNKSQEEIDDYLYKIISDSDSEESQGEKLISEGLEYYFNDDYDKAISVFRSALDSISKSADKAYLYRNISISYLNLEDYDKAISYAESAFNETREPSNEYLLAYVFYMADKNDLAAQHLERLINDYPRLRFSYILAAKIYDENKNYIKLEEISNKSKSNFPDNPPVVFTPIQSAQGNQYGGKSNNNTEETEE